MTIKSNFPSIRPSLNLDFANTRALDPRITFTRTTTASYYDGKTTAKAEENLLLQSQSLPTSWSVQSGVTVTSNTANAPDGTATADNIADSAVTQTFLIFQAPVYTSNTQYTISFFAKNVDRDYIGIACFVNTNQYASAEFDVNTGVVNRTSVLGSGWSIDATSITETPAGSGWYRCVMTFTLGTTTATPRAYFYLSDGSSAFTSNGAVSYLGSGLSVDFWGAQLEQRSAVSSYTPTTTAPITNYIPVLQTAASGVARFDHNPTTGESLGLLVEEQRTNICLQSEDFSTTWSATRSSITTNTIVAPNGTLTGDKLVEDTTASNTHSADQFITVVTNTDYTFSCYVKAAERSQIQLFAFHAASGTNNTESVIFNLSTLTVGTDTSVAQRNTITSVGNGWYRISGVFKNQIDTGTSYSIRMIDNSGNSSYTGDGYSGIYIWGAQVEAGAFPTSYIATTTASVTRNADVASMTGTNFSSWYIQNDGSVYVEAQTFRDTLVSSSSGVFSVDSAFARAHYIGFQNNAGAARVATIRSRDAVSQTQANSSISPISSGVFYKISGVMANEYRNCAVNGGNLVTDSTVKNVPENTAARIGWAQIGGTTSDNYLNGTIKKIAYYPSRLTNAQLQALTTV